jgi:hypothetical protein
MGPFIDGGGGLSWPITIVFHEPAEIVSPSSFQLVRGIVIAGGLSDLAYSDDQYLHLRPGVVLSSLEAPVQLVLEGSCSSSTLSHLRFTVEAAVNSPNLMQKLELFNLASNSWELANAGTAHQNDATVQFDSTGDATRFLNSSDHHVRARLGFKQSGPILSYPWLARIDFAQWILSP